VNYTVLIISATRRNRIALNRTMHFYKTQAKSDQSYLKHLKWLG